jgi:hypothetical protein
MLTLSLSLADAVASLAVLWLRWLRRGCAGCAGVVLPEHKPVLVR